jgi:hypothetical protein
MFFKNSVGYVGSGGGRGQNSTVFFKMSVGLCLKLYLYGHFLYFENGVGFVGSCEGRDPGSKRSHYRKTSHILSAMDMVAPALRKPNTILMEAC